MTPRRYGPLSYVPITRRPKLTWPGGARVALWVNPNIEFFGLDDVMPGNLNERFRGSTLGFQMCVTGRCVITETASGSGGSWKF